MRKSRLTEQQIIAIAQESAGATIPHLGRRHGISQQAFHAGRRRCGGMQVGQVKRLRGLTEENRRLERLVADQALIIQALRDPIGKEW